MDLRPYCFCLSLLSVFGMSEVAAAAEGPSFDPSGLSLAFSPNMTSSLPVDLNLLAARLCEGAPSTPPKDPCISQDCLATCYPVPTSSGTTRGPVPFSQFPVGGDSLITWSAGAIFEGREEISTPCGIWEVTLTFTPDLSTLILPIVLRENFCDPRRGVFAGVMGMIVRVHFVNLRTGQTADFTFRVGLSLAGPWAATYRDDGSASAPILFADLKDDKIVPVDTCNPVEILGTPDDYWKDLVATGCQVCVRGLPPEGDPDGGP